MKIAIWFFACLVVSMFITTLRNFGIYLGGIPVFLLYAIAFWIAQKLCYSWDKHTIVKKSESIGISSFDYVKKNIPDVIIEHCESSKNSPEEIKEYLNTCVKNKTINRIYADVIFDHYKQ